MSRSDNNSHIKLSDKSTAESDAAAAEVKAAEKLPEESTPPKIDFFEERIARLVEKGKRRGRRYSKIGIISSFLICISVIAGGYFLIQEVNRYSQEAEERAKKTSEISSQLKSKAVIHNSWKNCESNLNCIETQKDCCRCQAGGEQTAINFGFLDEWESTLKKKCGDTICVQVYKCQIGQPECKNGKCIFTVTNAMHN